MNIDVRVNLAGLDEVKEALCAVESNLAELRKSIAALDSAARRVGLEINQPSESSNG